MAKAKKASIYPGEDDWQAESDLRTLIEAEKIQMDDKRLKAAMKKREEQMEALKKVKG